MKLNKTQTRFLARGIRGTKRTYKMNHEIRRSCNSCGHQFDARKDGYTHCPNCNSTDLKFGKL